MQHRTFQHRHTLDVVVDYAVASPAMGHWARAPPPLDFQQFIFVYFGVNLTANYPNIV